MVAAFAKEYPNEVRSERKHANMAAGGAGGMFAADARSLLALAKAVFEALHLRFWINSGTLLGWLRQCDFIGHALDVDVGILASDYVPELIPAMENMGLRLSHRFGTLSDSFELSFKSDAGVKLDIFFFYVEDDHTWNGGTQARTGRKFKYRFPLFELCWGDLTGLAVRVPCDTEPFVAANYGTDWRKVVKQWDWKASPPNVKPNGVWPASLWPKLIQCDVCATKPDPFAPVHVDVASADDPAHA